MRIRVKFFAIVKERAGVGELELELPDGATVAAAVAEIGERVPAAVDFLGRSAFAINQAYAAKEAKLHDGDELAVIPPVSGG